MDLWFFGASIWLGPALYTCIQMRVQLFTVTFLFVFALQSIWSIVDSLLRLRMLTYTSSSAHSHSSLSLCSLSTFGASQPVYDLGESFERGHGGSWNDPPQVVPTVLDLQDVNYGPGGGLYGS